MLGFPFGVEGIFFFLEANHAAIYEMPHMILAAYMVSGFTVAGVYAAGILRVAGTGTTTPGSRWGSCRPRS